MTAKEIKDLIKLIDEHKLAEFKYEKGDIKLTIRSSIYSKNSSNPAPIPVQTVVPTHAPQSAPVVATPVAAEPQVADTQAVETSELLEVKCPIVGTFYRSPGPDKDPFIQVGDSINEGDVVCIVEAMKLFNEIESEVGGKIVKVLVEDASPVEYDQVLFLVDPKG